MLRERGEFVINLPPDSLARTVDYIGIYTGAKVDKFEKCSLTKVRSTKVAPPTVAECPVAIECRVSEVLPMGSHDVFIADIVGVSCHEDIMDSEGKMHFERAGLLAYMHGEYYSLGDRLGRFGFSTDKAERREEKEPFYKSVAKPTAKAPRTVSDKGAPHGKRKRGIKK